MKIMVRRHTYLKMLEESMGMNHVVKVITGMRRCGKSTLLIQFIDDLKERGISDDRIIMINFESLFGQRFTDSTVLNEYLSEKIAGKEQAYVFLDEVQNVKGWERSVAALCAEGNTDTYITGSNSALPSKELSTHLSGRYIEIDMLPLSFSEYLELNGQDDRDKRFSDYLRYGSLPEIDCSRGENVCYSYLEGVFNTVLVKDIMDRVNNADVSKILSIARFLYSNIGKETSIHNIAQETGIHDETVSKYVREMTDSLLFYYSEKYDIVGKKILNTRGKYYASDLGMRNAALMGAEGTDISRPLENVVFLELIRRGYKVRVGSIKDTKIDFTALKNGIVEYYQVTESMLESDTRNREFRPYSKVCDNYRKTILTMDKVGLGNENGVEVRNILDWLCSEELQI